jgi:hypothetical protein
MFPAIMKQDIIMNTGFPVTTLKSVVYSYGWGNAIDPRHRRRLHPELPFLLPPVADPRVEFEPIDNA